MKTKLEKLIIRIEESNFMNYCIKVVGFIVILGFILGIYYAFTRGFNC